VLSDALNLIGFIERKDAFSFLLIALPGIMKKAGHTEWNTAHAAYT